MIPILIAAHTQSFVMSLSTEKLGKNIYFTQRFVHMFPCCTDDYDVLRRRSFTTSLMLGFEHDYVSNVTISYPRRMALRGNACKRRQLTARLSYHTGPIAFYKLD